MSVCLVAFRPRSVGRRPPALTRDDFVLRHERPAAMVAQVYALDQVQGHVPRPLSAVRGLAGRHQRHGQLDIAARPGAGRQLLRAARVAVAKKKNKIKK